MILCKLFGHRPMKPGWYGDAKYGRVEGGNTDGINTMHFQIRKECDRCGTDYIMARFHHQRVLEAMVKHNPGLVRAELERQYS